MANFLPYFWIAVAVFAVFFEVSTPALVAVWFMPSALVAMILAFCAVELWIQIIVFISLSVALLVGLKPIIKKMQKQTPEVKTNIDAVIGQKGVITQDIDNIRGTGAVKLNGLEWTARAESDDEVFTVGDVVTIVRVDGVKLICKK